MRPFQWAVASVAVIAVTLALVALSSRAADTLPTELSDSTFWKMITEFSEPDGSFNMEIITSNETAYQIPIPNLKQVVPPGGVYLGVGPEQNFTYMSALRSKMGFIIDIRRDNMLELLLYKALFEISADRIDFISNLFSRKRPAGLTPASTATAIFRAFQTAPADRQFHAAVMKEIEKNLFTLHHFPLRIGDIERIRYVFDQFMAQGVTSFSVSFRSPGYAYLMTTNDGRGGNWSYLATEDNFRFIQNLERKNLIVPLVGDFAGPKTIRAVGMYLKEHSAVTAAFYVSNVEYYIESAPKWPAYCRNIAALPLAATSTFIRFDPYGMVQAPPQTISSMMDVVKLVNANRIPDYVTVLRMGH
jgi:hypothetical protein